MKILADTSVLIASLSASHVHHARARPWLKAAEEKRFELGLSVHAIAETYSVLTRIPYPAKFSAVKAKKALEDIAAIATVLDSDASLYFATVDRCVSLGLVSGAIFDGLHVVSAERWGADAVLTFNEADFVRLSLPTSPKVIVPPDPPAVTV
ncbi:MAG: PIN domain-containing protein [Polyangiaceae bacterium]|nr:PIN domain-containing protein [Polyangiaceae bacterium]